MSRRPDVIVCGAGPWGLAAAWRCAREGARVAIVDDGRRPAAHVAAGMLGARAEADAQEPGLLDLLEASLGRWPAFSGDLARDAGAPIGDRYPGTLLAAGRPEHIARVQRLGELLSASDRAATWRAGSAVRALEPALSPTVAGALELPEEGEVDPRRLLAALRAAVAGLGVDTVPGTVRGVEASGSSASVRLEDGAEQLAETVVIAAGTGAASIAGSERVRPVKGQILRLRVPQPVLTRVVRTPDVYIVPRQDGEVVVGATLEERGDTDVTAWAVAELLEEAIRACPDLREAELTEASAALRPATDDGRPLIGRARGRGPILALGGYRHGVLLTPLAADLVCDAALGTMHVAAGPGLVDPSKWKEHESLA